jgi:hypothetical protein
VELEGKDFYFQVLSPLVDALPKGGILTQAQLQDAVDEGNAAASNERKGRWPGGDGSACLW